MPVVTDRSHVLELHHMAEEAKVVVPVICYDGREDMEGALIAVSGFSREHGIETPVLGLSVTYGYPDMSQAGRVWRCGDKEAGLVASLNDMEILCGKDGPYRNVNVIPNLDHSDAENEKDVRMRHRDRFGTMLIDGSLCNRSYEDNVRLTAQAVQELGGRGGSLVFEGCLQRPAVYGAHESQALAGGSATPEEYAKLAKDYMDATGVDFLVVELGSKQQAVGWASWDRNIADAVVKKVGRKLVIHGGSSIKPEDMKDLGICAARFNMWTRMAYEAAQAGAEAVMGAAKDIFTGDRPRDGPPQLYRVRYRNAYVDLAVRVVSDVLDSQGYQKLAGHRLG